MYYAHRCAAHALNLMSDKRLDEAMQWISRANAVFDDPRITKYMADIAFEMGDYNSAIKHYRRANVWLLAGQQIYKKLQTTEGGDKLSLLGTASGGKNEAAGLGVLAEDVNNRWRQDHGSGGGFRLGLGVNEGKGLVWVGDDLLHAAIALIRVDQLPFQAKDLLEAHAGVG